ncbi:MAG: hypothetical protein KDE56_01695 [Anaerolineales bacterium]|nr:hypothetical protein [Anaerolineales bacterium]
MAVQTKGRDAERGLCSVSGAEARRLVVVGVWGKRPFLKGSTISKGTEARLENERSP